MRNKWNEAFQLLGQLAVVGSVILSRSVQCAPSWRACRGPDRARTVSKDREVDLRPHRKENMMRLRLIVMLALTLVVGCGADSPVAPSSPFPQVAGIYTGPITLSSSVFGSISGTARMEVAQSGSQVTITGTVTLAGETSQLAALTGAVNETGFFTATAGGAAVGPALESTCGTSTVTAATRTFVGRELQIVVEVSTVACGLITWSATLSR